MEKTSLQQIEKSYYLNNIQLKKIQAIAGMLFLIFLILHLSNTLLAIIGIDTYTNYQQTIQLFYQNPVVETFIVVVPLLTHAIVGIMLFLRRRKQQGKIKFSKQLHSWAGLFLLVVILGHVALTRGITVFTGAVTGFGGVSFTMWWMPGYFYPYYFLLFMAGLYHGVNGFLLILIKKGYISLQRLKLIQRSVLIVGAFAAVLALTSFGGLRYEIPNPVENDYAKAYSELFGIDLNKKE